MGVGVAVGRGVAVGIGVGVGVAVGIGVGVGVAVGRGVAVGTGRGRGDCGWNWGICGRGHGGDGGCHAGLDRSVDVRCRGWCWRLRWGGGLGGRDPCRHCGVDVGRWRWRRRGQRGGHGGLNGRLQVRGGDGYWGFSFSCAACQQECKSQHQCAKGAKNFHKPYLNVKGVGDGEGPLFYFRCVSRSAHLIVAEAVGGVVVYEAGGLHQGVADGAAHELEAAVRKTGLLTAGRNPWDSTDAVRQLCRARGSVGPVDAEAGPTRAADPPRGNRNSGVTARPRQPPESNRTPGG